MKHRTALLCAAIVFSSAAATAQIISTLAGNISVSDGLNARQTPLVIPRAVTADSDGFIYVGDDGSRTVRRIDPATGIATLIAGGGTAVDDLVPIPARTAYLSNPVALAVGPGRNLYIADDSNNRIRVLASNGFLTTVAGNGASGFSGDNGPAARARLRLPSGVAVDSRGNLYIADRGNRAIRKVDAATGIITTIAGLREISTDNGIPAVDAKLSSPWGVAVDSAGNIFFADDGHHVVRKIEAATGLIRTVAGTLGMRGNSGDGQAATSARLASPRGVAVTPNGDIYIGHTGAVRKVAAGTGIITTVLGGGLYILADGRPGTEVWIPDGVGNIFVTSSNSLLVALDGDNLIGRLELATGIFRTIAGSLMLVGDGGPAANSALAQPRKLALDSAGNLYVADTFHHRVRRIAPGAGGIGTGTITTIVGTGLSGTFGDGGPANAADLNFPYGVFVAPDNSIYISELDRIRRVGSDGIIRTVAGSSNFGFAGDGGPATSAQLNIPIAVVVDSAGNIYIADRDNERVRRVDTAGIIRTIAGSGETGYSGDGGPATSARLSWPSDLLLDGRGGLFIADSLNHRVRRVDLASGIITTVAGSGRAGFTGDGGPATQASMEKPNGLAQDARGNLYISTLNEIRRMDAATNIISTLAGTGDPGLTGDGGLATLARLSAPEGILLDSAGNVIFSDSVNNRVRRVAAAAVVPVLAVSPLSLTFNAVLGGAAPVEQTIQVSTTNLAAASWSASAQLNSGAGWLTIRPASGITPGGVQVAVNPAGLAAGTYAATVTIASPGASNSPQNVAVTFTVAAGGNPRLAVDRKFVTFRAVQGGSSPAPQTLAVNNAGGGILQWSSTVETSNGGNWLSVTPSSGTGPSTLNVAVTLGSLPVGVYQGLVLLTGTGGTEAVSVSFVVSEPVSSLLLSQTGALFTAHESATFIRPESIQVINGGQGAMNWQAQATSLSGGDWLSVSPATGSSTGGVAAGLSLSASPAGLRPGVYDALVTVTAAGATNSPQVLLARLNVQPAGTPPVGTIRPAGISLVVSAGGTVRQDTFSIASSGGSALSFVVSASTTDGAAWLSASPPGGALQGSANVASINVQAAPGQLPAGVYRGKVSVSFSTGVTQDVAVLFIVTPPGTPIEAEGAAEASGSAPAPAIGGTAPDGAMSACAPTHQHPLHTAMLNNFTLPVGWPTPILVRVLDNCGSAVSNSAVIATFTSGDEALVLRPLGNGIYSATWSPARSGSTVITVVASGSQLQPGRAEAVSGSIGAGTARSPLIGRNGVVNGASFKQYAPVAPGQIFSVFGTNLANARGDAGAIPLPRTLAGMTAKLGGVDVPLYYANTGQVNGQVPFELTGAGQLPLVVTLGGAASPPELVTLNRVQPGIFTVSSDGRGPGVIQDANYALISASNPARRGGVIVIYATGLGLTNPAVRSGESSPGGAAVVEAVSASVGGVPAVVEFAGLTPGFVGLYQVNLRIPANAPAGEAVELYLEQNQIRSNTVTLAIQ